MSDRRAVTIADRVFDRIRLDIESGRMRTGSKISEPELARSYGISRGPLREAIARLESCGLVVRRANVGARVVNLSSARLVEIYQVREVLEGMAARLAAERMTAAEHTALVALLEQHRAQIDREDGQAYFQQEGDLDFHHRIVQSSRNGRLIDLLCHDLYHLVRLYRCQFGMKSRRAPRALVEHEHIVEAIGRGDGELAELLMRHHIRASRENVERMLREAARGQLAAGSRQ
jgi:DNA-binding GntR family transcriptional regulator